MSYASQYDNAWEVSVNYNDNNWTELDLNNDNPVVANGKVCIIPSFDAITGAKNVKITIDPKYDSKTNTIETFNPFYSWLYTDDRTAIQQTRQSLNMLTGIFTSYATIETIVDIETDIYTPRHLPFCSIKTIRITPLKNLENLVFHHEISYHNDLVNYTNNIIYDNTTNRGIPLIIGQPAQTRDATIVSAYIIDENLTYDNLGFNVYESKKSVCFNKLNFKGLLSGTTYRVHIINVHMSTDDYDFPVEESKKIALNCVNKGIDNIRSSHITLWRNIWKTDINITPKSGIEDTLTTKVNEYKRYIRMALYNIYSLSRETVHMGAAKNYGFVDPSDSSSLMSTGDLFLIPLLLIMKPQLARSFIDFRFNFLKMAKQLAAGYGYKGSKYPYQSEQTGYKNSLYWNTHTNITYFNTALISINVWNYYRMTKDRQWLSDIGYPILKENAIFFCNIAGLETDNCDCCEDDTTEEVNILNTVSLSGIESLRNNAFTNNLIRHAVKAAIEASYELKTEVPNSWLTLKTWLPIPVTADGNNIYKFDDTYDPFVEDPGTQIPIAETWFNHVPYYTPSDVNPYMTNSAVFRYKNVTIQDVLNNINAYKDNIHTENIMNTALHTLLMALYMQYDASYTGQFEVLLDGFIGNIFGTDIWKKNNDITINAMFLFVIIQGVCQTNIKGGVSEARFYYEEMKRTSMIGANMPVYWKEIICMIEQKQFNTLNINV